MLWILMSSSCIYPPLPASGDEYLQRVADSRQKIAHVGNPFIRDGTVSVCAPKPLTVLGSHIYSVFLCPARPS